MAVAIPADVHDALNDILDLISDPGSEFYTLADIETLQNGARLFLNAPVALDLEKELGKERCFAESGHVLHVLSAKPTA